MLARVSILTVALALVAPVATWSAAATLKACAPASDPKVVFPFSLPSKRSGRGAILWLGGAPSCSDRIVGSARYGNSAQFFDKITLHALRRLAGFIAQRHKRRKSYGWWVVAHQTHRMGLIDLNGTIIAPRPIRSRRQGR